MSRKIIITDIIPIIVRLMNNQGAGLNSETSIRDENLIQFFEEELERNLSICGQTGQCERLQAAINEWKERDPTGFQEYIKHLLNKYINLQIKLRSAQKLDPQKITVKQVVEMLTDGSSNNKSNSPPDRFSNFRKQNPLGPDRWIRKKEEN